MTDQARYRDLGLVLDALAVGGFDVDPIDVADACWLANVLPALPPGVPPAAEPSPRPPPSAPAPPSEPPPPPAGRSPTAARSADQHLYAAASSASGRSLVLLPDAPALPDKLALGRALRPLRRRIASHSRRQVDEHATANQTAARRLAWPDAPLVPAFRPSGARWLDAILLVDRSQTMAVWQRSVEEWAVLLQQLGAFRNLRVWYLGGGAAGPAIMLPGEDPRRPVERDLAELIDPSGRRLVMIASDCIDPRWSTPAFASWLARQARAGPFAILQILPPHLWQRTVLARLPALALTASAPGLAAHRLAAAALHDDDELDDPAVDAESGPVDADRAAQPPAVPVVPLRADALLAWARLVAGTAGGRATGYRFVAIAAAAAPATRPTLPDPLALVRRFLAASSATARKLAAYLAAVPLTAPVLRLVRQELLPEAREEHLVEVLFSGLVVQRVPDLWTVAPGNELYDFRPGVREQLLSGLGTTTIEGVARAIGGYLERTRGTAYNFFATLDGAGAPDADAPARPFATVSAALVNVMRPHRQAAAASDGTIADADDPAADQITTPVSPENIVSAEHDLEPHADMSLAVSEPALSSRNGPPAYPVLPQVSTRAAPVSDPQLPAGGMGGSGEHDRVFGGTPADLVVLTTLPEEYAAVRASLRAPELVRGSPTTPNAHAWQLGTIDNPRYGATFRVAVGLATHTTTFAALAASEAIELFDPSYIAFVGVAGGFDLDGQRHGDVAISSVVAAYEYGKVDTGGFAPRGDFTYRCDQGLVRAVDAVRATGERWWSDGDNPAGPPRVRIGMIASGDKVIDDPDEAFFAAVRAVWPKLLAVEMEGAGVAAAVHEFQGQRAVGLILVRGISDMPHRKVSGASASTAERDRWKVAASRNAARFLAHLVATAWPIPPRRGDGLAAAGTVVATEGASGSRPGARRVAPPMPAYPNAEVQVLSEQLERARARKQTLRDAGVAADEIDREILQIRRQLRDGGQLRAGDELSDGRYLLVKPLGRGGFAVVWEAFDRTQQQRVAIKVLHQHLAGDSQRRERFFRGARVMLELEHPAVVRVLDPRGEDDAFCYFVMELVPGGNLRDAVIGQRVSAGRWLSLILQVGEALAEAHMKELIHRDVKPANILIDEHGNAKLTDFDLVGAHDTTGGTRTGALGTVVYAAPECLDRPQEATAQADVFGLGMTALFCLSGQDPSMTTFQTPEATIARLTCSRSVREVLARAVAWELDRRYADAGALVEALRRALDEPDQGAVVEVGSHGQGSTDDTQVRDIEMPHEPPAPKRPTWATVSGKDVHGSWAAFEVNGVRQRMRWIPPGTFLMGSPMSERGRHSNESPQHEVTLSRGYWLGETPVTQALWVAVMGENPSRFRGDRPDDLERPVEQVSWDDCQVFLARLNAQVGLAARLPTEAEWERACRAGTGSATWVGDLSGREKAAELEPIAWYAGNSGGRTHRVGGKAPNPFGLYDMLGNVWEWCDDMPDGDRARRYPSEHAVDPAFPGPGPHQVRRGGSWIDEAWAVRAAVRGGFRRTSREMCIGFRLAGAT